MQDRMPTENQPNLRGFARLTLCEIYRCWPLLRCGQFEKISAPFTQCISHQPKCLVRPL